MPTTFFQVCWTQGEKGNSLSTVVTCPTVSNCSVMTLLPLMPLPFQGLGSTSPWGSAEPRGWSQPGMPFSAGGSHGSLQLPLL